MGKYANLQTDIFSIFDSVSWQSLLIKTFPENYDIINPGNTFIRINVVASGQSVNIISVSGVLIIDIFTKVGSGPKEASQIADSLDTFLVGNSITGANSKFVCQFTESFMNSVGIDKDNENLFKSIYTIPFNYYGVK
jgi:hypothetical protein